MSSSIVIIIITVDHLVRSGRAVQYRGRGYSNRFDTLQRLYTLPTPRNSWPCAPIRVDQRRSDKTCLTRDSSIVPPTIIPPLGVQPWVAPCPQDTCHRRGQTNCPKRGRRQKLNWAHRVIVVYLIRAARTHNPPSLEVLMKEHAARPSQGRPIPANVAARFNPDR